ncbi:MFS transporter [Methylobacter sp. BBA5.1]|uniref:MFS transporter n=1 Tax=Methylobacter sp. BBA5.1 TaxID=1495064 RepID=UPI00068D5139|nr:MFS transporter [Methylobacter sp. BBA5.1]
MNTAKELEKETYQSTSLTVLGRPFYLLWCGETVALIGTSLMEFALGVWVYQKTGSALDFSGVLVAAILPAVLVMPIAGTIADRFDRRYVMVVADLTAVVLLLTLAWFLWRNSLEVEHLYAFNIAVSLIGAFRTPAYTASVSKLLPKEKYTQASGLMGVSTNMLTMFAPLVAGSLMAQIGLQGIVLIDIIAFTTGSILILNAFFYASRVSRNINNIRTDHTGTTSGSVTLALAYFKKEPMMRWLLVYTVLQQGLVTLASTMIMPLVLSHYSEDDLGIILTVGGVGGLIGSIILAAMGELKRLMLWALAADVVLAICILLVGVNTSFKLYCASVFTALLVAGFAQGCNHSLWMRKIPNEYQGRIFSIINVAALLTISIVTMAGGFSAEQILEPALSEGGVLEQTLGPWIGTGKGRGIGLMFVISGFIGVLISLVGFLTRLRRLDLVVPDAPGANER